ncbi:hypothetical protein RF11_10565 [Thelohanellus kitauei]|uniref:Uncharacterized protein n=1 Tax=Thelohanellus kitauei TaxID=669202 RepID=A0A0C2NDW3_THEKT|nr:hypothetical protein RF11_10565 [Thelohanellus kitauei]
MSRITKKHTAIKSGLIASRVPHTETCMEASFKIKTLSLINCEGLQSRDLQLSHLDMVNEYFLVIIVITECWPFPKTMNALNQVLGMKAKNMVITDCKSKLGNADALDMVEIQYI